MLVLKISRETLRVKTGIRVFANSKHQQISMALISVIVDVHIFIPNENVERSAVSRDMAAWAGNDKWPRPRALISQ